MAYHVSTAIKDIQSPNTLQLGTLLASPAEKFCDLLEYQDSWDQHLDLSYSNYSLKFHNVYQARL